MPVQPATTTATTTTARKNTHDDDDDNNPSSLLISTLGLALPRLIITTIIIKRRSGVPTEPPGARRAATEQPLEGPRAGWQRRVATPGPGDATAAAQTHLSQRCLPLRLGRPFRPARQRGRHANFSRAVSTASQLHTRETNKLGGRDGTLKLRLNRMNIQKILTRPRGPARDGQAMAARWARRFALIILAWRVGAWYQPGREWNQAAGLDSIPRKTGPGAATSQTGKHYFHASFMQLDWSDLARNAQFTYMHQPHAIQPGIGFIQHRLNGRPWANQVDAANSLLDEIRLGLAFFLPTIRLRATKLRSDLEGRCCC